jgi:Mrp family chromosome partitioning ATPase
MNVTVTISGKQGEGKSKLAARLAALLVLEGFLVRNQDAGETTAPPAAINCGHVALIRTAHRASK